MSEWRDGETSRLLIAEPPLLVLPSLATVVGLNEAIFLQQLHYWLLHSGKERDGRKWVYNTYDEWHAQLPFWSVRTIRRIVGGLEGQKLVLSTTRYNQQKVDQTKWYSLDYHALDDLTDRADQVDNVATSADRVDNLASWSGHNDPLQMANLDPSVPETTTEITTRDVEDSNIRRAPPSVDKYDDVRLTLLPYAEDLAREMNDQAPLASTTSRLVNLYRSSGLDMDTFLTRIDQARAITKERTAAIRGRAEGFGPKPKTQYFMAVLEDLTGREAS
jgi:hypothetical protein